MSASPGRAAGEGARSKIRDLLIYWLPPAAYVGLQFGLSSIHGNDIPGGFPNMDKVAHLLEYSLLGLLLGRAIRFTLAGKGQAVASIATILLGASVRVADELYQRHVPGRTCDIRDWIVDVSAVSLSLLLARWAGARSIRARAKANGTETGKGKR